MDYAYARTFPEEDFRRLTGVTPALDYWREYRTMFHITQRFQVSESAARRWDCPRLSCCLRCTDTWHFHGILDNVIVL